MAVPGPGLKVSSWTIFKSLALDLKVKSLEVKFRSLALALLSSWRLNPWPSPWQSSLWPWPGSSGPWLWPCSHHWCLAAAWLLIKSSRDCNAWLRLADVIRNMSSEPWPDHHCHALVRLSTRLSVRLDSCTVWQADRRTSSYYQLTPVEAAAAAVTRRYTTLPALVIRSSLPSTAYSTSPNVHHLSSKAEDEY